MDISVATDLSRLSAAVYGDGPNKNLIDGLGSGWTLVKDSAKVDADQRFAAATYQKGDLFAVTFRGTDDRADWEYANVAVGDPVHDWDPQFDEALDYVKQAIQDHGSEHLLVTGHSLGGSLAQVAAAMYNLDGVAFDPGGAQNIVASSTFNNRHKAEFDGVEYGDEGVKYSASFTNYVVDGSVVSEWAGPQLVGSTNESLYKPLAKYLQPVIQTMGAAVAGPLGRVGAEIAFTSYYLHDIEGIVESMEELQAQQEEPYRASFVDTVVERLLDLVATGDLVVGRHASAADTPSFSATPVADYVEGSNGSDDMHGGEGGDTLITYDGNDVLFGDNGDDLLLAASGNDTVYPGDGNDTVFAGSGDDRVFITADIGAAVDRVDGGAGVDTLNLDYSGLTGNGRFEAVSAGEVITRLDASASLNAIRNALASAQSFAVSDGAGDGWRTEFMHIEKVNLSFGFGQALVVYQGGDQYKAGGVADTFYADWSGSSADIKWENQPWGLAQLVDGVSVQGMERLLLITGSGNDTLANSKDVPYLSNDEFHTGAGDDTVDAGIGSDIVDTGPGNDTIGVSGFNLPTTDWVDGGAGSDTLNIDYSSLVGSGAYEVVGKGGTNTALDANTSLSEIRAALADSASFAITGGSASSYRTEFVNVERVNLVTGVGQALVLYQGGTHYEAKGVQNTFYADWSTTSADIGWRNEPWHAQQANGVSVQGMSRLLLTTGSGNDTLSASMDAPYVSNDEFRTGAGNDRVDAGPGNDIIDAGPGNDIVTPGTGSDRVEGGAGIDQVILAGKRASFTLTNSGGAMTVRATGSGDIDTLTSVERLAFDDVRLAFDLGGNAGTTAKVLGALFGKAAVANPVLTGIVLSYLDAGMSYESLVSLGVSHPAFTQLAGGTSNEAFVRLVYRNVVGTVPAAEDLSALTHLLDDGSFTRTSLAMLACETELNQAQVDLVGLVQTGLLYLPAA